MIAADNYHLKTSAVSVSIGVINWILIVLIKVFLCKNII